MKFIKLSNVKIVSPISSHNHKPISVIPRLTGSDVSTMNMLYSVTIYCYSFVVRTGKRFRALFGMLDTVVTLNFGNTCTSLKFLVLL